MKIIIDTDILRVSLSEKKRTDYGIYLSQAMQLMIDGTMAVPWAKRVPTIDQFDATLEDERKRLKEERETGTECRACHQFVKLYTRKLYSTQMRGLIKLVRLYEDQENYYHITRLSASGHGGDFAKLELFGLIRQEENEDTQKRASGMWQPTMKGINFVYGRVQVPSAVQIYNGHVEGFSEDLISIEEAINGKFNYKEVMEEGL